MGKLLINLSGPQEAWLRGEAARRGLPGGMSELVRRAIDLYRESVPADGSTDRIPSREGIRSD